MRISKNFDELNKLSLKLQTAGYKISLSGAKDENYDHVVKVEIIDPTGSVIISDIVSNENYPSKLIDLTYQIGFQLGAKAASEQAAKQPETVQH